MKSLILCFVCTLTSMSFGEIASKPFVLEIEYFSVLAKKLDYYKFASKLESLDEGLASEYSYNWSIGRPRSNHVIQAGCLDDSDKILVAWWSSTDREVRVTALAYYHCTRVIDFGTFPKFEEYIKRFKDVEAKERLEELIFVGNNMAFFTKWFKELTSDTLPKDAEFLRILEHPAKY